MIRACQHPHTVAMVVSGLVAFVPASLPALDPAQPTITKANNTIAPDRPESWVEGVVPGSLDIALWDATVTGPNTTTMTTGQNWGGIRVTNPGGPVTINGPQLALTNWNFMARTIDLSAATTNLTINGRVEIDGIHEWNVGGGRTLTVARVEAPFGPVDLVKSGEGNLRINAPLNFVGTLQIADGTVSIASSAPGVPFIETITTLGSWAGVANRAPVLALGSSMRLRDLWVMSDNVESATLLLERRIGTQVPSYSIDSIFLTSPLTIRRTVPASSPSQPVILETSAGQGIIGGVKLGEDALVFWSPHGPSNNSGLTVWQTGQAGNDFQGNVRFTAGPWAIRSLSPAGNIVIPDGAMVSIDAPARLTWDRLHGDYVETLDGLAGAGTMVVQEWNGASFTIRANTAANDGRRDFSGTADLGRANLVLDGAGAQTLAGSGIRHSGAITIESGRLVLRDTTELASASIALNGGVLEIERSAGDTWAFASPISGAAGDLVKSGAGTVRLDASAEHRGRTVVNGGTLELGAAGSLPHTSAVELNGGQFHVSALQDGFRTSVLVGTGAIIGPIFVDSRLAIGNSAGRIDFTDLKLMAGALAEFEVTGGGVAGDLGNVSGRLDLGGATLSLIQQGTFTPGQKFTLFAYTLSNLTGTFAGSPEGTEFAAAGGEWIVRYADTTPGVNGGTGDRFVTVTAIPEPAAHWMAVFAGLWCATRRRRPH